MDNVEQIKKDSNPFEIIMMVKEACSLMNCQIGSDMRPSGLTSQQVMVIKVLAHNKEMTLTQLCRELSLTKATVSGMIKRLEEADYVEKTKKDLDKRNTYIRLSKKGLEFAHSFRQAMNSSFCDLFKYLSEEEIMQIKDALTLLITKMK